MAGCRLDGFVRSRIAHPPKHLARLRVDAHGDFVIALARKLKDAAAREQRRSVPLSDRSFPFAVQLLRPRLRLTEVDRTVPVGTAPLRPILSPHAPAGYQTNKISQNTWVLPHARLLA